MDQRPRFRDAALDAQFERDGFVVVPGVARDAVRPMRRIHRRLVGRVPSGFYSTPYSPDAELKRAVHAALLQECGPAIDMVLESYRPLLASFVTKGVDRRGAMPPHMDWSFVCERRASSLNFWVPLVDVDSRNGAVSVLPGSHRMEFTRRGSGTTNPYSEIEQLAAAHMVPLEMKAGDALIHDHRVLHSSPVNRRRRPRVAIACALVHRDVSAIHFWQTGPGSIERYEIEDRFFTDHTFGAAELPASATRAEQLHVENPTFTSQDLAACEQQLTQHPVR